MGYMKHDAIIVTSWDSDAIEDAAKKARSIGLQVLGPGQEVINGFRTLLVCPDGSKEGWPESDENDRKRAEYIKYLNGVRHEDGSSCLEWVAVAYSSDDCSANIAAHAWEKPVTG